MPVQHSQGAQGIPPARLALALVGLDRHDARIPNLQRPPAVDIAFGRDQVDCLGDAFVGGNAGAAQVLESTQHVVVPPPPWTKST